MRAAGIARRLTEIIHFFMQDDRAATATVYLPPARVNPGMTASRERRFAILSGRDIAEVARMRMLHAVFEHLTVRGRHRIVMAPRPLCAESLAAAAELMDVKGMLARRNARESHADF